MQSKTSYFNKTIFKKNITHYWPVWAGYLLVCLFRLPVSLYDALKSASYMTDQEAFYLQQLENVVYHALRPFSVFFFACIAAVAVFSYLYQTRSSYMIHSLPVCRTSLFLTNLLSGICFLVIPQFLAFLAGIFVCFLQHMTRLEYLMHWLVLSTGMAFFAFSLAVLAVMITGNLIAAPAFFLLINYLYVACRSVIGQFMEMLSYGIADANLTFGSFLSPYYYINQYFPGIMTWFFGTGTTDTSLSAIYPIIGGYTAAGIPILLIAFLIYRKKHLETTGDFVAVSFLKPFFRWVLAFCIGSCVGFFGQAFLVSDTRGGRNLISLLILTAVGSFVVFFLTEMLYQKKFLVFCKKRFLECGIFLVLLLAFIVSIDLDVFGVESKVPAKNEISSVYIYASYPVTLEEADYDQLLSIHQTLVDSKKEVEDYFRKYSETSNSSSLELIYTLKNGKTLSRSYDIPVEDYYLDHEDYVFHQLEELTDQPEYYLRYHFSDTYDAVTFIDGSLSLYNTNGYFDNITMNQAQCTAIYEAFRQDVYEGNYRIYDYTVYDRMSNRLYANELYLSYYVPVDSFSVSDSPADWYSERDGVQGTNIMLTTDCIHTLEALNDLGFLDGTKGLITRKEYDALYEDYY